jgi:hypothetical protein
MDDLHGLTDWQNYKKAENKTNFHSRRKPTNFQLCGHLLTN